MNTPTDECHLCGLPLRYGRFPLKQENPKVEFCCQGCRQVYIMLSEAADVADPADFRHTDLFRRCVEMDIIPRSEKDLATAVAVRSDRRPSLPGGPAVSLPERDDLLPLDVIVEGMWCPACAWVIEETLRKQPGVHGAQCHFATDRLRCTYDPTRTSPGEIQSAVQRLGYRARAPESAAVERRRLGDFIRFTVSAFLSMNVMMLSFALYSGFFTTLETDAVWKLSWPLFLMATVVVVYGGRPLFRKGWAGIRGGQPGMETLISIGAASAYGYSVVNLLQGSIHLYFDTTCMLIFLVQLGKLLERRA